MIRALINSTALCFLLASQAQAMAPAAACSPEICPWLETVSFDLPKDKPDLVLKRFPSDGIEQYMPIGRNEDSGIPETVAGIWWMNFNQPGDILVTFGTASWDAETRTAEVPVYGERTYSFHATDKAAKSYAPLLATLYTYSVQFNEDFTSAEITPVMRVWGRRITIPKAIAHFTMRLVEDGHWVRESWVFGRRLPDYDFLRIVRSDLSRDPAYERYLKIAETESFLAVPREEAGQDLAN